MHVGIKIVSMFGPCFGNPIDHLESTECWELGAVMGVSGPFALILYPRLRVAGSSASTPPGWFGVIPNTASYMHFG